MEKKNGVLKKKVGTAKIFKSVVFVFFFKIPEVRKKIGWKKVGRRGVVVWL